jgi:hypothetical protein
MPKFLRQKVLFFKKYYSDMGIMVQACNPSTGRLRQGDQEFKDRLGYIVRPLKNCSKQNFFFLVIYRNSS